jgi:PAS domain S-box-containing protein
MILSPIINKVFRKFSLQSVLIVPFVVQIVGTVGLVGYISFKNGQEAVNDVASQLRREISDRLVLYLNNYLEKPHLINRINADAVRLSQLNLKNLPALESHLFSQLMQFESVDTILFGSQQGDFRLVDRRKPVLIGASNPTNFRKIDVYGADINGNRKSLLYILQPLDVRNRPWYQDAAKRGKPGWSKIFPVVDDEILTLNAYRPFYDRTNTKFLGVFSVNLNLQKISQFLHNLELAKSGEVFIIERSGLLIASSRDKKPFLIKKSKAQKNIKFQRLKPAESNNALISVTGRYLTERFGGNFRKIKTSTHLTFSKNGQRQFVELLPFKDEFGLDWLIVVVVPESDFMEQINANNRNTILLCIAALIGSTTIGILTARWVIEPILRLNKAAKDIAQGEWDKLVEIERTDEMGELAKSFNSMGIQLQQSFTELKLLNEDLSHKEKILESKIAERTEALRQSEEQFKNAFETAAIGMALISIEGKYLTTNSALCQILGYSESELQALTWQEITYPDDLEVDLNCVRQILSGKIPYYHLEKRYIHKTRQIIWVFLSVSLVRDEQQQPFCFIAQIQDITERKQLELALQASQTKLNDILSSAIASIMSFRVFEDRTLEYDYFSAGCEIVFGYTSQELIADSTLWRSRVFPEDIENSLGRSFEVIFAAGIGNHEYRFYHRDGSLRWISTTYTSRRDEIANCWIVTAVATDISSRKRTQEALRQSEERFREIATTIDQFFFIRSASSGEYLYVSPAYEKIWGRSCESLYQNPQSWMEAVHPSDRELLIASLTQQFQGNSVKREYRIIRADGEIRWLSADISVIRDEAGQPVRFVGVAEDISSRKVLERELALREAQLQGFFNNAPVGMIMIDEQLRYVQVNELLAQINGRSIPDHIGKSLYEVVPNMAPQLAPLYQQVMAQGKPVLNREVSGEVPSEPGVLRHWLVSYFPIPDLDNRISLAGGVVVEISSRKRAEEALRQSEEKFRQLAENIQQVFYIHDAESFELIYISPAFETIWGIPCSHLYENSYLFIESIHPEDRSCILDQVQTRTQQVISTQEYRIIRSDGEIRWIRASNFPVYDKSGRLYRIAGIAEDVSDRKIAQASLQAAKEAAEAASLAKSTFLANMSHELRTPLNGILGYAQILQKERNSNPKQNQGLEIIYQCGNHLLTLINDILDLSKIEAQKLELYPTDFNLSSFLIGISEIFRIKAEQKEINFTYLTLNQLPSTIHADEKRLRQVLINLISNAIKFTDSGSVAFKVGVLEPMEAEPPISGSQAQPGNQLESQAQPGNQLESQAQPGNQLESQAQPGNQLESQAQPGNQLDKFAIQNPKSKIQNQTVRFQIEDTGIGITPEQLEKIFLPFEQVGDTSRHAEGTGLGLAITQKLLALMGSKIFVTSTFQVGSTFWFDLTVEESLNLIESIPLQSTNNILSYHGETRKILVVDDRWENRAVIVNLLQPIGFELLEATNGQEGLETAVEFHPDLILADLVMPVMDGFEMTKRLRQFPQFQTTIIIALSANVFETAQEKSIESGCNDFLSKPVQASNLFAQIKQYLNLSWIYQEEQTLTPDSLFTEMVIPPLNELMPLYKAAYICDTNLVEQEALRLKNLYPETTLFANKIMEYGENFDLGKIMDLIEQALPDELKFKRL